MMKNKSDGKSRTEAMGEVLSFEALNEIAGGSIKSDYWDKLVSECPTSEMAFKKLVRDTKQGSISILIADLLVGDIEPYYEKKCK